jgi:hypothetical protein
MAFEADKGRRAAPAGPSAPLLADRREGPDLWGAGEAMRPLAELCLSEEAQTPFALALVGGRGAGKSFALRRLLEAVEAGARGAGPPLLSKIVVAEVDAAAGGDPARAVAAAVFGALERGDGATNYAALADEAAHSAVDPRHAAVAAAERHDEMSARLEQERRARDETESRRARLTESLLFETPGSRVDAFIRASRAAIEAGLRRFGFGEGDPDANFRGLVRDLAASRPRSRVWLFLRAIWAYRGQTRLLVLAILAFGLSALVNWLRLPSVGDWLVSLSGGLAPVVAGIGAHDDALAYANAALLALGFGALALNLWRAARFTNLLFRGLRLLRMDVEERRRALDASAARLERRVAALQIEADAAEARAETLARRAAGATSVRPPGPAFLAPADAPERAARAFLDELGRIIGAAATPAPHRILIALDGLDALPPAEARRFLETAVRVAGRGAGLVAAADLARLCDDPREIAESLFEAVYEVGAPAAADGLARLLAPALPAPAPAPPAAVRPAPLDEAELGYLKSASALIGPRPRALKRFYNAYRLARLGEAPRAAVALSLAALMAPDAGAAAAWRWALSGEGFELAAPAGHAGLRAAFDALGLEGADKAAARAAFEAARRFAPWG